MTFNVPFNPRLSARGPAAAAGLGSALPRRLRRFGFGGPLEEIREEMDRMWSSLSGSPLAGWPLLGDGGAMPLGPSRFPAVNVHETDEAIVVEAELPGVKPADLDISAVGDELVIKGCRGGHASRPESNPEAAREKQSETAAAGWLRRERGEGSFERRVELPVAIDPSKVEAKLVDGVLTLRCAKAAECQPHKIEIRA